MNKEFHRSIMAKVDALETIEQQATKATAIEHEDMAVAMNAVTTIVGRQGRRFFSQHDMKAVMTIKAVLQSIPNTPAEEVRVVDDEPIPANEDLERIASAAIKQEVG